LLWIRAESIHSIGVMQEISLYLSSKLVLMPIHDSFIAELQQEAVGTRKMLASMPSYPDWKPHEKSMTLGNLVRHIAELPGWLSFTINSDELDFSKTPYTPKPVSNAEEAVAAFDKAVAKALEDLRQTDDVAMMQHWTLRDGDKIHFTLPKVAVLRSMVFNHLIHHRGQLSVYLRLLDVPLSGVYGPTADDKS